MPYEPEYVPACWNASYEALYKKEFHVRFPIIYIPCFEPNRIWAGNAVKAIENIRELEKISIPEPDENMSINELLNLFGGKK